MAAAATGAAAAAAAAAAGASLFQDMLLCGGHLHTRMSQGVQLCFNLIAAGLAIQGARSCR
jgi:hypothetical protein